MYNADKEESQLYTIRCESGVSAFDSNCGIWGSQSDSKYARIIVPITYTVNDKTYILSSIPITQAVSRDAGGSQGVDGNSHTSGICTIKALAEYGGDVNYLHDNSSDDSAINALGHEICELQTTSTSGNHTYNLFEAGNMPADAQYLDIKWQAETGASCSGATTWANATANIEFKFIYLALDLK